MKKVEKKQIATPRCVAALKAIFDGHTSLLYGEPKTGKSTVCAAMDAAIIALDPSGYKWLGVTPIAELYDPETPTTDVLDAIRAAPKNKVLAIDSVTALGSLCERETAKAFGVSSTLEVDYGKARGARNANMGLIIRQAVAHPAGCILVTHTDILEFRKQTTLKPLWIDAGLAKVCECLVGSIVYYDTNRELHTTDFQRNKVLCGSNDPYVESVDGLKLVKVNGVLDLG